ncbi:periodic tryptophan protein 1 [Plasmodium brasilianum]|uniref:Periodic tryptophan protein 1, putative n=3 Tax=Plasmodium (Plasmodium) TaxID=418103 RepID=A0A1D3TFJ0_PLAMA|nr:periodic tryptophan protein 1, putative [Plasmodium malariae]KAI4835083.1 periodic tryptophan protein 1 [Plasmodium brasilianum]SCP03658.1 periodic tryptophan protein 1, putative [Plasmodium malariae]
MDEEGAENESMYNIVQEKKNKKIKKKKLKKEKNVKVNDIVSCIAFLSKDEKKIGSKKDLWSEEDESSSIRGKNKSKKKRKKKSYVSESNEYIELENVFNDEHEYRKVITEDSIIANDKKYIYEDELHLETDDVLILNGKIYSDVGTLETHIFNYDEDIFNIYDDAIIDNYPLCLQIINTCSYYKNKNIVAIGTLNKDIGLWDVHNIQELEALSYLGNKDSNESGRKKGGDTKDGSKRCGVDKNGRKKRSRLYEDIQDDKLHGHSDCVTCLNLSKLTPNLLCSGSKDCSIILWDLSMLSPLHSFNFHNKKINNISFHTTDRNILLSTSSDKTIKIFDIRKNTVALSIPFDKTPESTIWSIWDDSIIFSSDVKGYINKVDIRQVTSSSKSVPFNRAKNNIVQFKAFNKSCVALLSPIIDYKNLILAGSEDGIVKVFDFSIFTEREQPHCVYTKNMDRNLFCMQNNEDWPNVVFLGCDQLYDWDLKSCNEIRKYFKM